MTITLSPATEQLVVIYALRDPITMDLRYVGKADDPERRFRDHLSPGQLDRYRSRKNSWLKGLVALGLRPYLEIVDEVPADQANEAERYWIEWYRSQGAPLTNGTDGGDGGAITDPEALARIRAAHLGVKASEETRAKMSASAKRRCADEAERDRLRSISNGKPPVNHGEKNPRAKLSDEQVRALREQAAAGEELRSLAVAYGITPASVTQLVTGKFRKAAGGPTREPRPTFRLTDADVAEIRRLYGNGKTQSSLARKYGLSQGYVSQLCSDIRRHQ